MHDDIDDEDLNELLKQIVGKELQGQIEDITNSGISEGISVITKDDRTIMSESKFVTYREGVDDTLKKLIYMLQNSIIKPLKIAHLLDEEAVLVLCIEQNKLLNSFIEKENLVNEEERNDEI